MSSLIPFSFESREIRVLNINGEPWFVAKDVCEALGYKDAVNAIKQHCKGVAKYHPLQTAGGLQEFRIIREPDTYRLIVGCTLPEGERFEAWVFEKVIPTIRKTGRYEAPDLNNPYSDFGPKAQFAVLEMLVSKVSKEIAAGFIDYLRERPASANPPPRGCPAAPTPPERPRRQPIVIEPADPWEAQAREFLANRGEATTTELLAYCGIPPEHQTQNQKNRAAKLLKYIGYRVFVAKRDHRTCRVYQRFDHA